MSALHPVSLAISNYLVGMSSLHLRDVADFLDVVDDILIARGVTVVYGDAGEEWAVTKNGTMQQTLRTSANNLAIIEDMVRNPE